VLAALTLANFRSMEAFAADQIRFAATGQDPNDVARFLDLAFPIAALLLHSERRWLWRLLALAYLPLGLAAVVLTASRGGFLAAIIALGGCGLLLVRSHAKLALAGALAWLAIAAVLWSTVPHQTFDRLATIPSQLQRGDLNQRLSIWSAGWRAFVQSPVFGTGAGSFVSAARMNPLDTAHNTVLSIAVGGGLCALSLALAMTVVVARLALKTRGPLLVALATLLLVLAVASLVDTVEENRATWLLLGLIAVAGRLAVEDPRQLEECFPEQTSHTPPAMEPSLSSSPVN